MKENNVIKYFSKKDFKSVYLSKSNSLKFLFQKNEYIVVKKIDIEKIVLNKIESSLLEIDNVFVLYDILFQLKISASESNDFFYEREDGNKIINIGSRRYGEIPHSIKGSSPMDLKKLAIGYICLKLIPKADGTYQINPALSFCVFPKLELLDDKQYYYYPNPISLGHNPILVDMSMMNNIPIGSILKEVIVLGTPFVEEPIVNPYDLVSKKIDFSDAAIGKSGGYYYKYLKYKSKYLKLKGII